MIQNNNNAFVGERHGKSRESNLELFRIITMLFIIAHHYVVNSGLIMTIYQDPMDLRSLFLLMFGAWGKTGINCFVMITGYFMCKSQVTTKKFVKLLADIYLYRIVFFVLFLLTGYETFSVKRVVKLLLPFTEITTDFTSCYLVFLLCIPFLNILIHNMTEKQHVQLIFLMSFIYVVFGTVPKLGVQMNYVSWFSAIYFMASYIRMYPKPIFQNTRFWGWTAVAVFIISLLSVVVCAWIGTKTGNWMAHYFVTDSNKVLAVLTAFSAFLFFKNLKIGYSKIINTTAASTFGVLLIHANSDAMRKWLWQDLLNNVGMYDSKWLIVHALGSTIGVFAVCTLIDFVRSYCMKNAVDKIINRER